MGFLVSLEYPSCFVCNDGHSLTQYDLGSPLSNFPNSTAGFQVRLCHTLILSLGFNDSRDLQLRSKYFFWTCCFSFNTLRTFTWVVGHSKVFLKGMTLLVQHPWETERGKAQLQELEYFVTPELLNSYLCYPHFLNCFFEELLACLYCTFQQAIALRKSWWWSNMLKLILCGKRLKFQAAKFRAIMWMENFRYSMSWDMLF